jgi:integrase
MTKRRAHGDGGLHWDERRKRWIATITIGYNARGKRVTRTRSGKTKTEAKDKLKEIQREYDDGLITTSTGYTVSDAVAYWLAYGLSGRDKGTIDMYRTYAETHIIPALGKRPLRELTVDEVEKFLADKSGALSTRSLRIIHSILRRSIKKAQVRDKIRRNIILLCEVPEGRIGRPSKSLTLDQAEAVLTAADRARLRIRAYIVVSLLTGARTEEMRALRWHAVHPAGEPGSDAPVPPHVELIRSVRAGGDTKTRNSRRAVQLAQRTVEVLRLLWEIRSCRHSEMSICPCLVFVTWNGTPLGARNVQRDFRKVIDAAGLTGKDWTPRELRQSFVSLLSDAKVPVEVISRLVGHRSTTVTETVYRKQLRPVIQGGADVMDRLFPVQTTPES